MRTNFLAFALLAPFAASLAMSSDAFACGGCVAPPETNTIVNAHRMALSISPKQTVLWDQIQYKGAPESFGWLLPVKEGATIELSTDAWFETLDAATTTNVTPPPLNCGGSGSSGFGCSADEAGAPTLSGEDGKNGGVQVVHRGTVGPFETVTLKTQTPGVLDDWLANAGFNIPAETAPVIDAYIAEGFDFIALKLQPGKNIDEMKPVRVLQPGAVPTLPLRMVAVGTGANVAVTLYIIGEGRWEAENFMNAQVPVDLLAWDFGANSSNYSELREKSLSQNGGDLWLTSFSRQQGLTTRLNRFFSVGNSGAFTSVVGEAYVQQGMNNGETTDNGCAAAFTQFSNSGQIVVDPCPPGVPSYDASCGVTGAGEIDARLFECGATDEVTDTTLDDISTALTGLHPKDTWVTRLEANLPRSALKRDLVIKASSEQLEVNADLQARLALNTDSICGTGSSLPPNGLPPSNDDKSRLLVLVSMFGLSIMAFARKRLRPNHSPTLA